MFWQSIKRFLRARDGASAVEMALIFPILIVISLGVFELSGVLFFMHRANEAMTETARASLIEPPVVDLDLLPVECPGGGGCDATRLDELLAIAQRYVPGMTAANLRVKIESSGVSSSNQAGIVTPIIRVELTGLQYHLIAAQLFGFGASFTVPPITASQFGSMEQQAIP